MPPRPPSEGGRAWLELETADFLVRTDLDEGHARAEMNRLEELRAALLTAILPNVTLPTGQMPVIVLADRPEWTHFFSEAIGGMMIDRVLFKPLILYSGEQHLKDIDLVKHELTHFILRLYLRHLPPWFDEGLAAFFETMQIDEEHGTLTLGAPSRRFGEIRDTMMPLDKVVAYLRAPEDTLFYATSWLLVHYLMYHETERFAAFRRYLQSPTTAERAWDLAFAERPLTSLETDVREYTRSGKFGFLERRFTVPRPVPAVRRLGELEVRRVFATLYLTSIGAGREAAEARRLAGAHVDAALRLAPRDVEANALAVVVRDERGPVLAERAHAVADVHPESWLAWALVALSAATEAERGQAETKARELSAGDPAVGFGRPAADP